VDLQFYTGTAFPARYRGGAFMTSHGSWNRAPGPMAGYNILFHPLMSPAEAAARPNGTAQGPDGSLYITESVKGKTWRVVYNGK
jgi:glucose/arabinose dehydrogenase